MLPSHHFGAFTYRPLNIEAACYTRGLLLVSEVVQNGTASRVLAVAKDLSVSGVSASRERQAPPYRETVAEMNGGRPLLPGELCCSWCRSHATIVQLLCCLNGQGYPRRPACAFIAAHLPQVARHKGVRRTWLNRRSCAAAQPGQSQIATEYSAAGGVLALSPALTALQLLDLNDAGLADDFAVQQAQQPLSCVALTDSGEPPLGNE